VVLRCGNERLVCYPPVAFYNSVLANTSVMPTAYRRGQAFSIQRSPTGEGKVVKMSGNHKGSRGWFQKGRRPAGFHKALASTLAVLGLVLMSLAFVNAPVQAAPADVCPEGGDWTSHINVNAQSYTYPLSEGEEVVESCYKAGNTVVFGTSATVTSTVWNKEGCPEVSGCNYQDISHASFRIKKIHDECPELDGNQPPGTDCTQPPDDRDLRDLPGVVNCETRLYTVEHQERFRSYSWDGDSWETGPWSEWVTYDTTVTKTTDEQCPNQEQCPDGYQDEDETKACYVEREPDRRVESGTRQGCKLGGVETTTTVYTTTYSFNEATQKWESSKTRKSSVNFRPYTKTELKEKGCLKSPPPDQPDNPDTPDYPTSPPHAGASGYGGPSSSLLLFAAGLAFIIAGLTMLLGIRRLRVGEA